MKTTLVILASMLLTLAALFISCSENEQKENKQSLSKQLIGEWRNTYLKIEMPTFKNSNSVSVLELKENNWEAISKTKPIRTFFRKDGTYNSEHRDLKDSIFYNPAGKWNITGDSITMVDTFPEAGLLYKLKITLKGSIAEFSGIIDFDQDGKRDDKYYGTQKKFHE